MHVNPFLWLSKNFSRFEGGHFVFARYGHQGARSRGLSSFLKTLDPILPPCQILKFVQNRQYCGDQKDIPIQLLAHKLIGLIHAAKIMDIGMQYLKFGLLH